MSFSKQTQPDEPSSTPALHIENEAVLLMRREFNAFGLKLTRLERRVSGLMWMQEQANLTLMQQVRLLRFSIFVPALGFLVLALLVVVKVSTATGSWTNLWNLRAGAIMQAPSRNEPFSWVFRPTQVARQTLPAF